MWEYNYHPSNELYHSLKTATEQTKANARYELELFNAYLIKRNEIEVMEAQLAKVPPAGRSSLERTIAAKKKAAHDWLVKRNHEYFELLPSNSKNKG